VRARRDAEAATGVPAKLVATAGPASGEAFALDGDELVVGRASDNAISIPDTSVSRKHLLIRRAGEGWAACATAIRQEGRAKAQDKFMLGYTNTDRLTAHSQ
jgi:hypothetical protein